MGKPDLGVASVKEKKRKVVFKKIIFYFFRQRGDHVN